jgi:SAM-dependent methyltransferase
VFKAAVGDNEEQTVPYLSRKTMNNLKLSPPVSDSLICPVCKANLVQREGSSFRCSNAECALVFPVVDNCPVIINEANSVFAIDDYESKRVTTMDLRDAEQKQLTPASRVKQWLSKLIPPISRPVNDFPAADALATIKASLDYSPRILVIGAGDAELELETGDELVYSDVAIGRLTQLVCDAHDIPFPDDYFDAVIAEAVFEHVANPYRCADEIHRVLKPNGFLYAITPFMQQVHMGRYDFTRFTHLGHRRLFRRFSEERSGVSNAQGMVLAWSIERFISGFSDKPGVYHKLRSLARFVAFPFLAFDKILARKAGAYDSASAYYFFGRKSDDVLSDRELIKSYRGLS